jgi:hypothetical protein
MCFGTPSILGIYSENNNIKKGSKERIKNSYCHKEARSQPDKAIIIK